MYNSQEIAKKIKEVSKINKIPVSSLLDNCNLGKNTVNKIANGADVSYMTIVKIADYLEVSVDYLLGRDIKNNAPDDNIRNAIFEIINNLPDEKRIRLLGYLEALAAE